MDRLTGIRVFVAAVNSGSFAAAARHYGLSAAMAGKYVSAIETGLNARLLHRTTPPDPHRYRRGSGGVAW